MISFEGKKALVIGTGISGVGAVHILRAAGASVTVLDENEKKTPDDIRGALDEADQGETEIVAGKLPEDRYDEFSLVVPSPAVPSDTGVVAAMKERGVPVWSEIELGYRMAPGRVLAITGTNGKTTTTTLVGEIMKAFCPDVYVVGNIGFSYAGIADRTGDDPTFVAEVSSFQLENVEEFKPAVSAILNITPDHLNRHHTMENYIAAKEAVAARQTKDEVCVLNYEDPVLREFGENRCPARTVFFSSKTRLEDGYYLDGEVIFAAEEGKGVPLMSVREMKLVGVCNAENVMAAIAIARAAGVPMETIIPVVKSFNPVPHRIEFVATRRGVDYYNDSKGTNPDAAIQGIRAMTKPTVLIGGGYDKGSTYDEWVEAFDGQVKEIVLIGQTREAIAECCRRHGLTAITLCDTFEEALSHCTEVAEPGDAVLLSPACASWGMFPNYEVRGERFKDYVTAL